MKKYLYLVLIILNFYSNVLIVPKIEAASVSTSVYIDVRDNWPNFWWWSLQAHAYVGSITTNITKVINFVLPDGTNAATNSNLNIGQSIILNENYSYASWSRTGGWRNYGSNGWNSSGSSNGQWYQIVKGPGQWKSDPIFFLDTVPFDQNRVNIVSSDPSVLECSPGWGCIAKSPGYAIMTVNFPDKSLTTSNRTLNNNNTGFGFINIAARANRAGVGQLMFDMVSIPYSFAPIYYGVTVNPSNNTPPSVMCSAPTDITTNGATINWFYSDDQNNTQTGYQVQVATDSNFSPASIVWSGSNTTADDGNTRSLIIPSGTLTPSTTYYTRISVDNGVNSSSGWVNCNGSFTTNEDDIITNPTTCICDQNRAQVCTTRGNVVTTPSSSACSFGSACLVTANDANTATISIIPQNGLGPIKYEYGSTVVTQNNNQAYMTTVNKIATTQSLSVTLTDKDLASSNTTCNIDAKGTTPPPSICENPSGCSPTIIINKKPAVTLNKNGQCTISWTIQNLPDTATCLLGGWGVDSTKPNLVGSKDITTPASSFITIPGLQSNQKYTIACSGPTLNPSIVASVICRVNPDVKEN